MRPIATHRRHQLRRLAGLVEPSQGGGDAPLALFTIFVRQATDRRAEFFELETAKRKILEAQRPFLERALAAFSA